MYLTQGLHRALQRKPESIATVCGGRCHTVKEFGTRVAKLGGALQRLGVRDGARVGVLAQNADRYYEVFLGVFWAGGSVNPVNIRWSPAEIAYSLDDCDTQILIVDEMFASMAGDLRARSKSLRTVIFAGNGETPQDMLCYEAILDAAPPVPDVHRAGDDLAAVLYTGGTTGFPKGVMLSQANLYANALNLIAERCVSEDSVVLIATPMFHVAGVNLTLGVALAGGRHVFISAYSPEAVLEAIARERVTLVFLVPTMIQMLLDHPGAGGYDLSSLKCVMYGASPISEALLERAMAALPGIEFAQAYGMTELASVATVLQPYYHSAEGRAAGKLRSAGRATFFTEVRIVDREGNVVPRGTVGEIAVRGPGVMLGYWNKPAETASAVRGGWMHTGDGGYMDGEGFVFVVDRMKDMIVTGGENVYSAEVENALARHPAVALCAVIGIPDDKWGERVHAVVVLQPGARVNEEDLRAHCREFIAGYKCPRSVEFRSEMPLSAAGKLLKYKLREPFWRGRNRAVG